MIMMLTALSFPAPTFTAPTPLPAALAIYANWRHAIVRRGVELRNTQAMPHPHRRGKKGGKGGSGEGGRGGHGHDEALQGVGDRACKR